MQKRQMFSTSSSKQDMCGLFFTVMEMLTRLAIPYSNLNFTAKYTS